VVPDPTISPPFRRLWVYPAGSYSVDAPTIRWVLAAGGRVFLQRGTANSDGRDEGETVALDAATGTPLWSSSVYGRGLAYEGGRVFVMTEHGTLVALDAASGAQLFARPLDTSLIFHMPPVTDEGTVYVVGRTDTSATVFALRESDGGRVWTQTQQGLADTTPAISGNKLVVSSWPGTWAAFDRLTGDRLWGRVSTPVFIGQIPEIAAGRVWLPGVSATAILDPTHGQQMGYLTGGVPSVDGDVAFISDDSQVVSVDVHTLADRWRVVLPDFVRPQLLVTGAVVWAASAFERVTALDAATGAVLFRDRLNDLDFDSTAGRADPVAADGRVFFPSDQHVVAYVHADHMPAPEPTFGPSLVTERRPALVGDLVSCQSGWAYTLGTVVEWLRDGVPFTRSEFSGYRLTQADGGHDISCRVTASGDGGTVTASTGSVPVEPLPTPLTPPRVEGTRAVGATLTCINGRWEHATSFDTYWRVGESENEWHSETYVVRLQDRGKTIECHVLATGPGGGWDAVADPVTVGDQYPLSIPAATRLPYVTGSATVGGALECHVGDWVGDPTSFAFGWRRDGVALDGAQSATYVVTSGDAGHRLACHVAATGPMGTGEAYSAPVDVPAAAVPIPPGTPPAGPVTPTAPLPLPPPPPAVADTIPPHVALMLPAGCTAAMAVCRGPVRAWRSIGGRAGDLPSAAGLRVQVRAQLVVAGRCRALRSGSFRAGCRKGQTPWVGAALKGGSWRLALPGLRAGRLALVIRGVDAAGNVSTLVRRTVALR
jgi:outer membrane protein assembly factor BamB